MDDSIRNFNPRHGDKKATSEAISKANHQSTDSLIEFKTQTKPRIAGSNNSSSNSNSSLKTTTDGSPECDSDGPTDVLKTGDSDSDSEPTQECDTLKIDHMPKEPSPVGEKRKLCTSSSSTDGAQRKFSITATRVGDRDEGSKDKDCDVAHGSSATYKENDAGREKRSRRVSFAGGDLDASPPAPIKHHSEEAAAILPPPSSSYASSSSPPLHSVFDDKSYHTTLNNREYIKLNLLGKGGSSSVYRMISKENAQIYAFKRVDVKDSDDSDAVFDSYANEISLLHRLKGSPYIIELVDYEVRKDQMYVAMLLEVGDVDLAKVLNQRQPTLNGKTGAGLLKASTPAASTISSVGLPSAGEHLDPFFCRMVWKEMLQAVHHIHENRIVHGDLKPANFVFVKGHLKLIDFGIAKSFSSDTTNIYRESQIGTVNYMAPEAIAPMSQDDDDDESDGRRKMRLGRASDIWSLGCILYQIIYGRPPFASLNTIQKLASIPNPNYKVKYPLITNGEDGDSIDAVDSVKACLKHDPRKRAKISGEEGCLLSRAYLRVGGMTTTAYGGVASASAVVFDGADHSAHTTSSSNLTATVPIKVDPDRNKYGRQIIESDECIKCYWSGEKRDDS
jgi:hypothetical protein